MITTLEYKIGKSSAFNKDPNEVESEYERLAFSILLQVLAYAFLTLKTLFAALLFPPSQRVSSSHESRGLPERSSTVVCARTGRYMDGLSLGGYQ